MTTDQTTPQNPLTQYPKPPFQQQHIDPPGLEAQMNPRSDYGEQSYRGSNRLTGRVALITGGARGIGRATALAFAREGADIAFCHLDDDAHAGRTAANITALGRQEDWEEPKGRAEAAHAASPELEARSTEPIRARIKRQARPDTTPHWQDFAIPYKPGPAHDQALVDSRAQSVGAPDLGLVDLWELQNVRGLSAAAAARAVKDPALGKIIRRLARHH